MTTASSPEGHQTFESVMSHAVRLHDAGEYSAALVLRRDLYDNLDPTSQIERGRVARDVAASYDRLGNSQDAEIWAKRAFSIHNAVIYNAETFQGTGRNEHRERSVSAMYLAVVGARKAIESGASFKSAVGSDAVKLIELARADIDKALSLSDGQKTDQYEINLSRRESIIESLFGDDEKGWSAGWLAVRLAFMSESPRIDTHTPGLSLQRRLKAKAKALAGGIAAVGINMLTTYKDSRRRDLALKVAKKVL